MSEVYGSDPSDIRVMIGPSVGPDYEVDDTVAGEVRKCLAELSDAQAMPVHPEKNSGGSGQLAAKREDILRPSEQDAHWYLDLWSLNREILLGAGLRDEHIFCMGLSTLEYPGLFFSHRRSGGRRGLNAGIIALT